MCGISVIIGGKNQRERVVAMVDSQHHRGPDARGMYVDPQGRAALGHNRLSILDLSDAGRQPMSDSDGRYWIVFNGEVYNYLELRHQLESSFTFRSRTDTEVLLAAFQKWGTQCLDRFIGMFAFAIWDEYDKSLFCARDRFGVKPLYYHHAADGSLYLASEIKALFAAGIPRTPDESTWATYLTYGLYEHTDRTFWQAIRALPPGHLLTWHNDRIQVEKWYDLAEHVGPRFDDRPCQDVQDDYSALLRESVALRFRSDVPVGINLSGGLDSSTLLGLVQAVQGSDSDVKAFTFATGDPNYDELPWVAQMLTRTQHPSVVCNLSPRDVPSLAESVQFHQEEPFGGLPTLAYARLFERAREERVIVLLDGQGMDEQWAGYDYYRAADRRPISKLSSGHRPEPSATGLSDGLNSGRWRAPFEPKKPFADPLRNLQYRDARYTKIPRALRFNDRVSMRASTELREPFLDHRLFELALRQSPDRKIRDGQGKWLLRQITRDLLPEGVVEAPKRPLQTPQREWLRGDLRDWANDMIHKALSAGEGSSAQSTSRYLSEWRCDTAEAHDRQLLRLAVDQY